jgi:hypothetical protein
MKKKVVEYSPQPPDSAVGDRAPFLDNRGFQNIVRNAGPGLYSVPYFDDEQGLLRIAPEFPESMDNVIRTIPANHLPGVIDTGIRAGISREDKTALPFVWLYSIPSGSEIGQIIINNKVQKFRLKAPRLL